MLELLRAIGGILLVDIVLSGDNALVIGAVSAGLSRKQRRSAIIVGGTGAAVFRIFSTLLATYLLRLPWLQAAGGLLLLLIAIHLLMERPQKQQTASNAQDTASGSRAQRSLLAAMLTILAADVTMSLDNVLAVGAIAHGNFPALVLGLLLSIFLLLVGSSLVAELIRWLPWLFDIAALVLAWTGADMMLHDQNLGNILDDYAWTSIALPAASLGIVLAADAFLLFRAHRFTRSA